LNIYKTIEREAATFFAKNAVVYNGKSWTYGEMFDIVNRLANELKDCSGATVALRCYDSSECVFISLALLAADAVLVPVPPAMPGDEVHDLCESIGAGFFIETRALSDNAYSLSCCGKEMYLNPLNGGNPLDFKGDEHPAFIRFSSGTTADSKGVMITHKAVIERTAAANYGLEISSDDTVLWVLSMAYHFVVTILLFLRRGATIVICHEPTLLSMAPLLEEHDITVLYATPYHYRMMTRSDSFTPEMLSHSRLVVSTAMALDKNTANDFKVKFGTDIRQAYGIIEVGLPCISAVGMPFANGLVGHPLPAYSVELREQDELGVGGIAIKGPGMFDGYVRPCMSFAEACPGGWFDTGDLGRFDDEGNLYIVGRSKNIINFAGMKIFPGEVESVIKSFPGVTEVMVYGIADTEYGELPCADVIGSAVDIADLRRHCYEHLSSWKVPKEFNVVDRIEKTLSGKNKLKRKSS